MTDRQLDLLLSLILDKFASCETMEDVKKVAKELRVKAGDLAIIQNHNTNFNHEQ